MEQAALAGSLAILALYVGALYVAIQHIAERYTPNLIYCVLRQSVPVVIALLITTTVSIASLLFTSPVWDTISAILLILSLLIGLYFSSLSLRRIANSTEILSWIPRLAPAQQLYATEQALWNVSSRLDRSSTEKLLSQARALLDKDNDEFLAWLLDLVERIPDDILGRALIDKLIAPTLRETRDALYPANGEQIRLLIAKLLLLALRDRQFARAEHIVDTILLTLSSAKSWTGTDTLIVFEMGWILWRTGMHPFGQERSSQDSEELDDIRVFVYRANLAKLFSHITSDLHDHDAADSLLQYISRLLSHASLDCFDTLSAWLDETIELAYEQGYLSQPTLQEVAARLGLNARNLSENDTYQEYIDALVFMLAATSAELGASNSDISHLLGNGGIIRRARSGAFHIPTRREWLNLDSYGRVENLLSYL